MKKRLFTAVLTGVMAATCAIGLAACGDGADDNKKQPTDTYTIPTVNAVDTFIGTVSEKTYADENAAVKAYFSNELCGEYVSYSASGALSAKEVAKLGLEDATNVKKVNKVDVRFKNIKYEPETEERGVSTSADTDADVTQQQAYSVEYKDGTFKYYSPRPSNGEVLTKSYYASLLDGSKYTNCTAVITDNRQRYYTRYDDPSGEGVRYFGRSENTETYTVSNGKFKMERVSKDYEEKDGEMVFVGDDEPEYWYWLEKNDKTYQYVADYDFIGGPDVNWVKCTVSKHLSTDNWRDLWSDGYETAYRNRYEDYSDLATVAFHQMFCDEMGMLDFYPVCTLLRKTETGFEATEEAYKYMWEGEAERFTEKYYRFDVSGGKVVKIEIGHAWLEDGKTYFKKGGIDVKDFGTTADFDLPEGATDDLDEYIAEEAAADAAGRVSSAQAFAAAFDFSAVENFTAEKSIHKAAWIDLDDGSSTWETYYSVGSEIKHADGKYLQTDVVRAENWVEYYPDVEPTYSTANGFSFFEDYDCVFSAFDKFKYDVSEYKYVAVVRFADGEYLCEIKFSNGVLVSVEKTKVDQETAVYTDGQTAILEVTESIYISDIGSTSVENNA